MTFTIEKLKAAGEAAVASNKYDNLQTLSDEELIRFYSQLQSVDQISFLHNADSTTILHDGVYHTMSMVRGPSLDALIWYVKSRLNDSHGFYGDGIFDGSPVFVYFIGKLVEEAFEFQRDTQEVVEKTKTTYVVRINLPARS